MSIKTIIATASTAFDSVIAGKIGVRITWSKLAGIGIEITGETIVVVWIAVGISSIVGTYERVCV